MIHLRLLAPLAALALLVAGCGDDKTSGSGSTGTNSATTPAETTSTTSKPVATTGQAPAVANAKDLKSKPEIAKPGGDPPTTLIKKDLVVGSGPALKTGETATVQYIGLNWSNGEEFDSSWSRGAQPISFPIGVGQVIPGWDEGVPGMKVGGRRILVIPPDQAYGQQGSPPTIGPNETLVFVIDLTRIG